MIPDQEREGLLLEADEAEKAGGFVKLTPEYTRHLMRLLHVPNAAINQYVADVSSDWNAGLIDRPENLARAAIFWVIEDRLA